MRNTHMDKTGSNGFNCFEVPVVEPSVLAIYGYP